MSDFPPVQEVVLAAVNSLGQVDDASLTVLAAARVADIVALLDKKSEVVKIYNGLTGDEKTSKQVFGWLEAVDWEKSSNRAKLKLVTKPHPQHNPKGIDFMRSERLESPIAANLAGKAKSLIGHNVVACLEMQTFTDSKTGEIKNLRVLRDVRDQGEAKRPDYS